jgi:hypothetical protein
MPSRLPRLVSGRAVDSDWLRLCLDAHRTFEPSMPDARLDLGMRATIHLGDSYEVDDGRRQPG